MKKSSIIGVLILCFAFWGKAQVRNEIRVPDPEGYRTLKCDFHIHTVFSDGLVWPTVRVDEAYREGLDAIALTEHLEYRPHRQDIIASHNRSYEIAEKTARNISKNVTIKIPEHFIPSFKPSKSFVTEVKGKVKK